MSLFAAKPPAPAVPSNAGAFGDFGSFASATTPSSTSATGAPSNGLSGLNSTFGGLDLSSSSSTKPPQQSANTGYASANPWSTPAAPAAQSNIASGGGNGLFDTQDVWGTGASSTTTAAAAPKKDDAFADIWGDFK